MKNIDLGIWATKARGHEVFVVLRTEREVATKALGNEDFVVLGTQQKIATKAPGHEVCLPSGRVKDWIGSMRLPLLLKWQ